MEHAEHMQYWKQTAQEDFQVAQECFEKARYSYCLFFCHMAIEKTLKAICIQNSDSVVLLTHNLLDLLKTARLDIDVDTLSHITEINSFNIRARYDDYKRSFYEKATKVYTVEYLEISKQILLWLETQFH